MSLFCSFFNIVLTAICICLNQIISKYVTNKKKNMNKIYKKKHKSGTYFNCYIIRMLDGVLEHTYGFLCVYREILDSVRIENKAPCSHYFCTLYTK